MLDALSASPIVPADRAIAAATRRQIQMQSIPERKSQGAVYSIFALREADAAAFLRWQVAAARFQKASRESKSYSGLVFHTPAATLHKADDQFCIGRAR